MKEIAHEIATIGAYQNRIQSTVDVALETMINISYASSRIKDVNHAQELTSLSRSQIRFYTGQATMDQAKNISKEILYSLFVMHDEYV